MNLKVHAALAALSLATAVSAASRSDRGSFANPSVLVRPKFRYWIPDASVAADTVAGDVQAAGEIGAGGLELLGYYLYGGPPSNGGGRGTAAPVDWAKYGFGTPAWHSVFQSFAKAHQDNDLLMDFAIGPNQGTGVPAIEDSDGLMWDIAAYNISVPIGSSFSGTLPGWGTGELQAAVVGTAIKSETASGAAPGLPGDLPYDRTQITLSAASLKDVTSQVSKDGHLNWTFASNSTGLNNTIFAIYLIHSDYRAQDGPGELGGPQTAPQSFVQNGSWAVDHFSALGARTTTAFWEKYILTGGTREILENVGHYGWEDSVEIEANVYWTKNFTSLFKGDHGYSITKWLPLLFHRNGHYKNSVPPVWWITDEPDNGDSHIADYRETLGNCYHSYLSGLNTWAEDYLRLQFSAQISYNLPMDMLSNIPNVDVPECESLDFSDLIDGYRQYSGPAHLAGRPIVSSECGAVKGEGYTQTLPELLWHVKRSFAGSINQFVFHGLPYSGEYGNTTWPVFTTFDYAYSNMHGPHEPAWDFYKDQIDYVARNNFILQSGTLKADIAFWQKITTVPGHIQLRTYEPSDLEEAGYTYEYLSPDNLDLPFAEVVQDRLAPDAQSFKAMVIRANDSLTVDGVDRVVKFAHAGLPVVFLAGVPSSYLGTNNAGALAAANTSLHELTSLGNVHVTADYTGLASTLNSVNINPATSISTNGSWFTVWRNDNTTAMDYIFVYNDAMESPRGQGYSEGTIEVQSMGTPYEYDAWTGAVEPVLVYTQTNTSTTIPLKLAGNQSTIIGFDTNSTQEAHSSLPHLSNVSSSVFDVSASAKKSEVVLKCGEGPCGYVTSNGTSRTITETAASPITLSNWTLVVEHWDPPSNLYNITAGAAKHNTTHLLPTLVSWQSIPGLQNVSGRGYYSASFTWPPKNNSTAAATQSSSGAILSFGGVVHTLRASINGHDLPPLDVTDARADIKNFLVKGKNRVNVVVATPLGNVLRTIWNDLETSGTSPSAAGAGVPGAANYGLLGEVAVVPYVEVKVRV